MNVDSAAFQERMQRVEELIAAITEHGNAVVRASAVEMVRVLLDVHRAGLEEIVARITEQGEAGQVILNALIRSTLVSRLLILHGLHPIDLETRVRQALNDARPLLHARVADVELESISHDVIRIRLRGGSADVQALLEHAILAEAPDVLHIEFIDADASARAALSLPLVSET
jgi:hypothetical protein